MSPRPGSGPARGSALVAVLSLAVLAACSSAPAQHARGASSPPPAPNATRSATPSAPPRHVTAQVLPWRLPAPLSRAVAMPFGGGALVAGGLQPGDHSTDQVLTIDLRSGPHGAVGHLPVAMHDSAGAVVRGRPTVFGGGGATELSVVQQRDRSGRWRTVGNLPGARSDLSVLPARSGVLVVGGYDGANTPTAVLRTSDGKTFSVHGQLPEGIRYAGVAIEGDTGWIVGGERDGNELDEVLQVDLASGAVRRVGTLPHPLGHEGLVAVGGRLLLVGGRTTPDQVSDRLWWWRPHAGSRTPAGRLPYPVADAATLVDGDYLYLLGGETPAFTDRVTRVGWR